jgi:predicted acylesterase/phospholipase RssA
VPMQKRLWTDGGVVTNQPIRPAVRLGADVLFLVMVEPQEASAPEVHTFLDVGLRAIDILIAKNLIADLKLLGRINSMCEAYAAGLKLRPEQVQVEIGPFSYKFVKAFTICPQAPLDVTALDFEGDLTSPAILQGYRDGGRAVLEFADYAAGLPAAAERRVIRLVPQAQAAKA